MNNKAYSSLSYKEIKVTVKDIMYPDLEKRNLVVYTGYGGMMVFHFMLVFKTIGRKKLPRKMKKRIWKDRKTRVNYSLQYYVKPLKRWKGVRI